MKTFVLKADIQFEAENIDDTFAKLAEHFSNVEESNLFDGGEISVKPMEDAEESE